NLFSAEAMVELDFGSSELLAGHSDGKQRPAFVQVDANGLSMKVEVSADGRGIAMTKLAALTRAADLPDNADPVLVSLTLLRSSSESNEVIPTRFRRKLVVWPGFEAQMGVVLKSKKAPENFI